MNYPLTKLFQILEGCRPYYSLYVREALLWNPISPIEQISHCYQVQKSLHSLKNNIALRPTSATNRLKHSGIFLSFHVVWEICSTEMKNSWWITTYTHNSIIRKVLRGRNDVVKLHWMGWRWIFQQISFIWIQAASENLLLHS